jgi:hypothetical protein
MSKREIERWITVKGVHVPIFEGQTKEEAVKNYISKEEHEKQTQIAKNKEQASKASNKKISSQDELVAKLTGHIRSQDKKEAAKQLTELIKKDSELSSRMSKIQDELKHELDVPKNATREDRQIAWIMGDYTRRGKELDAEYDKLSKESREIRSKMEELTKESRERIKEERKGAYKEYINRDRTKEYSENVKKEYKGFQLDTGTSDVQRWLNEGSAKIVEMSPKFYLEECAYKAYENATLESTIMGANFEYVLKYAEQMEEGTKFYMPWIDYVRNGQEGRHRALAAFINGYEKIPVVIRIRR